VELVGINCCLRAYRFFFWINDANDELDFLGDFIALTFVQYYLMAEWKQSGYMSFSKSAASGSTILMHTNGGLEEF
jgi:hypothetical protein